MTLSIWIINLLMSKTEPIADDLSLFTSSTVRFFCSIIAPPLTYVFMFFLQFHFILEERGFIPNSFNYLKSLVLSVSMADWVVPSIISLLNCSPNLEALTIYFEGVISTPKIIAFVRHCFFYLFTFIISLIYELKIKAF